jgi:hypothetical protein
MARNPSASAEQPNGGGQQGGKARPNDPTGPGRAEGNGMENDPVVEGSADPWAESDAGHPDESSSDSLDQHPQPEDETTRDPTA